MPNNPLLLQIGGFSKSGCCSDLEELHPEIFSTSYLKRPLLAPWLRFQSCFEYGVESAPGSCAWKHAFTYCNQISRGSKHRCIHALSICMASSLKILYAWKFMSTVSLYHLCRKYDPAGRKWSTSPRGPHTLISLKFEYLGEFKVKFRLVFGFGMRPVPLWKNPAVKDLVICSLWIPLPRSMTCGVDAPRAACYHMIFP